MPILGEGFKINKIVLFAAFSGNPYLFKKLQNTNTMGLFDEIKKKLSHEFIDIIEWLDNTNDTIVHRFERYQNEIKNGAKLIVREGQMAVFINEGQLADVFKPGTYTLNTQNLPILTTLKGWKYGFDSPFKAEVYFVNTRLFTDEKWGTKNAVILNDERFGLTEIRAFGTYSFKIQDPGKFIVDVVGTDGNFTNYEINEHLKSLIVTQFTDTVGEANLPIELYAKNAMELSETCQEVMQPEFGRVGILLEKFYIENVSMPLKMKEELPVPEWVWVWALHLLSKWAECSIHKWGNKPRQVRRLLFRLQCRNK